MLHSWIPLPVPPAVPHLLTWHWAVHEHLLTSVHYAGRLLRDITLPANPAKLLWQGRQPEEIHKVWLKGEGGLFISLKDI